jgi:hypothetical protein
MPDNAATPPPNMLKSSDNKALHRRHYLSHTPPQCPETTPPNVANRSNHRDMLHFATLRRKTALSLDLHHKTPKSVALCNILTFPPGYGIIHYEKNRQKCP